LIRQLRRTAVHEAGHAVFAVFSATRFDYVIVKSTGAGHLLHTDETPIGELRWKRSGESVSDIIVALAGEMAERSLCGGCVESGLARDREMVRDALKELATTTVHQARIRRRCRSAVAEMYRTPAIRAAVEAVAAALERQGRLMPPDVEQLVLAAARQAYREFPDIDTT
jgi:hypothetical protein